MQAKHNSDYRQIFEAAKAAGWRIEQTAKNHFLVFPPDKTKRPIGLSGTPSDWRSIHNERSRLRRAGLAV